MRKIPAFKCEMFIINIEDGLRSLMMVNLLGEPYSYVTVNKPLSQWKKKDSVNASIIFKA